MMMNNMDGSMGGMMMGSSPNTSNSTSGSTMNQLATTNDNNGDSSRTLNITAYQQAQGLAMRALQIFNNDLKPTSLVNGSSSSSYSANASPASTMSNAINKIENNLIRLKDAIESKAPTMDVMKIVHGDIHPALLISYKLQLRR
ncbi:MAG: hypothetical protein ACJ72Q_09735 [Nitrososphaeraceae archaeon]